MRGLSEVGRLTELVLKHPREAFATAERIDEQWRALNFVSPPDLARAIDEYDRLLALLTSSGATVHALPDESGTGLDSLYVRDASAVTPSGMVLCRMGKSARAGEPLAQGRAFSAWGIPVLGTIEPPGTLEGGDVVWLGPRLVAVGRGYRTNAAGIAEFRRLLADTVDEVFEVPLPHWRGDQDVFHLMSIVSPIAERLAVVYAPLLPVPFRERLIALGWRFIEVPDEEFGSMGANVLALAPGRVVALAGNPRTRAAMEAAGVETLAYAGLEISLKGGGGPTCLTRPIVREPVVLDA